MSSFWASEDVLRHAMQKEKTDYFSELEKEAPSVYPVLSASDLLAHETHQKLLTEIKRWIGSSARFDLYYKPLIDQFAFFVQALKNPDGDTKTAMLNTALLRAHSALSMCRNRFLEAKPAYFYAAFSAILLRDIGKIDHGRRIEISDEKGAFLSLWQPCLGPLPKGGFYKVRPIDNHYPKLSQLQNSLLAKAVLPKEGFSWVSEDQHLFVAWLAYLNQYEEYYGNFGTDLDRIVSQKQNKTLQGIADDKAFKPEDMLLYECFLIWLKMQLEKKKLSINQENSKIHVTKKKGVWISNEVVKLYQKDVNKRVTGAIIQTKFFNAMGIPSYGEMDYKYKGFFGAQSQSSSFFGKGSATSARKDGVVVQHQGLLGSSLSSLATSKYLTGAPKASEGSSLAKKNKSEVKA
jgi:hypothetical protein